MKICTGCGMSKSWDEFYKHPQTSDGYTAKCKECTKAATKEYRRNNRAKCSAYEKKRQQTPERKKLSSEHRRASRQRHREHAVAMYMVTNAIRDKKLIRQPCVVCGDDKVDAHHEDYYKPLEVEWLCRKHHLEKHGKQQNG